SGTPTTLDQNEWFSYIKNIGDCSRPTQSFIDPKELKRVKAVCSKNGGKTYKDNLCISQQPFTFVTVRSVKDTCGIKSVLKETKHLILACEVLDNECVPVHFEGNPTNLKPDNNA
uniref:Si:dkey-237j11.3 n=2 Tax=Neolamprologus brichardi TaxID=32507 RepID=A0A3Q4M8L7_NEOBR